MSLKLVWHNPDPPTKVANKVRRVQSDRAGAVYEVYEVSNHSFGEKLKVVRGSTESELSLKPGCKRTHHSCHRTPHFVIIRPPLK
jgi:hypothetical protein